MKIVTVLLSIVFLCNTSLYACLGSKDSLRLHIGKGDDPSTGKPDDSLSRIEETMERIAEQDTSLDMASYDENEIYRLLGESKAPISKKYIDTSLGRIGVNGRRKLFRILDRIAYDKGFSQLDVQQKYTFVMLLTYRDVTLGEQSIGLNQKSRIGLDGLFVKGTSVSFADISRVILAGVIDDEPDIVFNKSNRMLDSPRTLLIGPYKADAPRVGQFLAPPMGLYRIASYLDIFGMEVDVYDTDLSGEERLKEMVEKNNYDFIGFSLLHPTIENDIKLMHMLHEISPDSIFVAGGQGGVFNYSQLLNKTPIDVVVRGFGEFGMLDMTVISDRDGFTLEKFNDIPGLHFRRNDREISTTRHPDRYTQDDFRVISLVYDFSKVPYDEYWAYMREFYSDEQLAMMKNDKSLYTIRVITSSHCPMGCFFCSATNFLDDAVGKRQKPLLLSVEDIAILMRKALREYPVTEAFYFSDDDFLISRRRILRLVDLVEEEFKDNGLYFLTLARTDDVTPELLKRMKDVNFGLIIYGVESFSDRLLEDMHKKVRIKGDESAGERGRLAVEWTLEAGIVPLINLLVFYPTTQIEDLCTTIDTTVELMRKGARVAVNTYVIPFAGSKIAEMEEYEHEVETFTVGGQLFSTGERVLPTDGKIRKLAEDSLQMKVLILEEIRQRYDFREASLPLPVDTLALFAAIYRNLGMATDRIDEVIEEIMSVENAGEVQDEMLASKITEGSPAKCLETFHEQFRDEKVHIGNEANEEEGIEASGLIKARGMGRSTVYEELKWLIKMGLVRRTTKTENGRKKRGYYELTEFGRGLTKEQLNYVCGIKELQRFKVRRGEVNNTRREVYHRIQNLSKLDDRKVFFLGNEVKEKKEEFKTAFEKLKDKNVGIILVKDEKEQREIMNIIFDLGLGKYLNDRCLVMTYKEAGIAQDKVDSYKMQILGIDDFHCIPLTPVRFNLYPELIQAQKNV